MRNELLFSNKEEWPLLDPYYGVFFQRSSTNERYYLNNFPKAESFIWEGDENSDMIPVINWSRDYDSDLKITLPEDTYSVYFIYNIKSIRDFLNYSNYRVYPADVNYEKPDMSRDDYKMVVTLMLDDTLTYGNEDEFYKFPYVEPPSLKSDLDALPELLEYAYFEGYELRKKVDTEFLPIELYMYALFTSGHNYFDSNGLAINIEITVV